MQFFAAELSKDGTLSGQALGHLPAVPKSAAWVVCVPLMQVNKWGYTLIDFPKLLRCSCLLDLRNLPPFILPVFQNIEKKGFE